VPVNSKPTKMVLDPFVELLFDGSISEADKVISPLRHKGAKKSP